MMGAKRTRRKRHVPQRTCVGCREVLPKRSLVRVVRTDEGVLIDPTSKVPGRGAYLHEQRSCWERALEGSLANALRVQLSTEDHQHLVAFMEKIADRRDG